MKRKILIEILCSLLVLLFLYAGISKLLDIEIFKLQLANSPWIKNYNVLLSVFLPVFEIITAVMILIGGRVRQAGLLLYAASLSAFSIYITAVLLYADNIPCSCGGLLHRLSWPQHIALNLSFMAIAITVFIFERKKELHQKEQPPEWLMSVS